MPPSDTVVTGGAVTRTGPVAGCAAVVVVDAVRQPVRTAATVAPAAAVLARAARGATVRNV